MAFAWFPRLGEFPPQSTEASGWHCSMPRRSDSGTVRLKFARMLFTAADGLARSCIGVAVLIETKVLAYRFDSRFPIELTIKLNR